MRFSWERPLCVTRQSLAENIRASYFHMAAVGERASSELDATPLAKQEFVVAASTHPGNMGGTTSAAEKMKPWLRPADRTETFNAMEKELLSQVPSQIFVWHSRHAGLELLRR
jgi:hypothetical protein